MFDINDNIMWVIMQKKCLVLPISKVGTIETEKNGIYKVIFPERYFGFYQFKDIEILKGDV
jgi:hypothetical protein